MTNDEVPDTEPAPEEAESEARDLSWAHKLVDARAWVLHQPTCTVGRVAKLHAEGGTYTSSVNDEPVMDSVLELEEGHGFVARAGNFVQLSEADVKFFQDAQVAVSELTVALTMIGAAGKIAKSMTIFLVRSALQGQLLKMAG